VPADNARVTDPAERRPAAVVVAAVLSAVLSLGPLWFGFEAFAVLFRTGGWGDSQAAKGMVFVGVLGLAVAVLLIGGAVSTWRGSFVWTIVLLLAILLFGFIGEGIELLGTPSDTQGILIGAAVILGPTVPIGLLSTRPARKFAASRRQRP
jgi:hypothetical protein